MHKYIAKLKDGFKYDDELIAYLDKKNIEVQKQLETLDLLIITSKKPVSKNDFNCFEVLEMDDTIFSV